MQHASTPKVRINVIAMDGCPQGDTAWELAQTVVNKLGSDIALQRFDVDTPEMAEKLEFVGCPIIRVNDTPVERQLEEIDMMVCCSCDGSGRMPLQSRLEQAVRQARGE